jgi:hypothetical protein
MTGHANQTKTNTLTAITVGGCVTPALPASPQNPFTLQDEYKCHLQTEIRPGFQVPIFVSFSS